MSFRLNRNSLARIAITLGLVLGLVACGGGKRGKNTPLEGDRLSVLALDKALEADPTLSNIQISLPKPYVNFNWAQAGGGLKNSMHHLAIGEHLSRIWDANIGQGSKDYEKLTASPVIADGVIYTMDVRGNVRAFRAENGRNLWLAEIRQPGERSKVAYGGGLAFADGKIYATTGYGILAVLDASSGSELWRHDAGLPLRGAPTVADGRVFILTHDNQLFALSASDGDLLWDFIAIAEDATVLGASSPAVDEGTLIAAFASGELMALRAANGQMAWQDALTRTGSLTALATLNDIVGQPVVDRGRVYAINHSGRFVAVDIRSGERVWENNIASLSTPWIAGSYIFVVTADGEVVAVSALSGRVHWVTPLQRFQKPEKRKGVIRWSGPVLAGDRLFVVSSHGYLLTVSPYTGEILSGEKLPDGTVLSPIVANETLYVLTDGGKLLAYR
jgi:outer membrane protein assembly factor BamB